MATKITWQDKITGDPVTASDMNQIKAGTNGAIDELDLKQDKEVGKGLSQENFTSTLKTKLDGVATSATANATNADLRDRATHTGEQPISSVTGLQTALNNALSTTDFINLTFGSTVAWDQGNVNYPQAQTTATTSFTLNVTNSKSGSMGLLSVRVNTTASITIQLQGSGLSYILGTEPAVSITLPASTSGKIYLIQFVNLNGTVIVIANDYVVPNGISRLRLATTTASAAVVANTDTPVVFQSGSETYDTGNSFDFTTSTSVFKIPGTGPKRARVWVNILWASGTGDRFISIAKDNTFSAVYYSSLTGLTATGNRPHVASFPLDCNGGDSFTVLAKSTTALVMNSVNLVVDFENF